VQGKLSDEYRYLINTVSIHAILTNTIRYRASIDTSGIEAEPANSPLASLIGRTYVVSPEYNSDFTRYRVWFELDAICRTFLSNPFRNAICCLNITETIISAKARGTPTPAPIAILVALS
jgi:hypothetical protein